MVAEQPCSATTAVSDSGTAPQRGAQTLETLNGMGVWGTARWAFITLAIPAVHHRPGAAYTLTPSLSSQLHHNCLLLALRATEAAYWFGSGGYRA